MFAARETGFETIIFFTDIDIDSYTILKTGRTPMMFVLQTKTHTRPQHINQK